MCQERCSFTHTCPLGLLTSTEQSEAATNVSHNRSVRVPKTTPNKWWNCQVIRPVNCCHLIPSNRFHDGFPDPSQFAAAKLTHFKRCRTDPRTPRVIGNASCSQVMCTRILALLPSIDVPCVQATSQVVG